MGAAGCEAEPGAEAEAEAEVEPGGAAAALLEAEAAAEVEGGCSRASVTGCASWKLRTRQRKCRSERSGHSTWVKRVRVRVRVEEREVGPQHLGEEG